MKRLISVFVITLMASAASAGSLVVTIDGGVATQNISSKWETDSIAIVNDFMDIQCANTNDAQGDPLPAGCAPEDITAINPGAIVHSRDGAGAAEWLLVILVREATAEVETAARVATEKRLLSSFSEGSAAQKDAACVALGKTSQCR